MRGFLEKFKQYGFINFIKRAFLSVLSRVGIKYSKWLVCRQKINIEITPKITIDDKFCIREMTYIDYCNIPQFSELKLKRVKQRISSKNYYSYGVFDNNNLAYYCWISLRKFQFSNDAYNMPLKSDEGLLFDAFCFPKYRGNKLHNYMNIFRLKKLLEHFKSEAIVVLLNHNKPARRSQRRAGFICNKSITIYTFFGRNKIVIKNKLINL